MRNIEAGKKEIDWKAVLEGKTWTDEAFLKAVQTIKEKGANGLGPDDYFEGTWRGFNLLHVAAFNVFPKTLEWLLKSDAKFSPLTCTRKEAETILRFSNAYECAIINNDVADEDLVAVFEILYAAKPQLPKNSPRNDWSLVHHCVYYGFEKATEWLLNRKKDFNPNKSVNLNDPNDEESDTASAWEIPFISEFTNDDSCLFFMKLFSEKSKRPIPTSFQSILQNRVSPIHLSITAMYPKTLAWLLNQPQFKDFNFAKKIDSPDTTWNKKNAANLPFCIEDVAEDSEVDDEMRVLLWKTMLESNVKDKKPLFLQIGRMIAATLKGSGYDVKFLLTLLEEAHHVVNSSNIKFLWANVLKDIYDDLLVIEVFDHLQSGKWSLLDRVSFYYLHITFPEENILEKNAADRMRQKCVKPLVSKLLISAGVTKETIVSKLNDLVLPFECGKWEIQGQTYAITLSFEVRHNDRSISREQFKLALISCVKMGKFSCVLDTDKEILKIRKGEDFDLSNFQKVLRAKLCQMTEENPVKLENPVLEQENQAVIQMFPAKKLSFLETMASINCQEEWKKREKWVAKGAPFAKKTPDPQETLKVGATKSVSKKSKELRNAAPVVKPSPLAAVSKKTKVVSENQEKNLLLSEISWKEKLWRQKKLCDLKIALDFCHLIQKANEDLSSSSFSVLNLVCQKIIGTCGTLSSRFTSEKLHTHIIFLSHQYSLMKASAIIGYIFWKEAEDASSPVNYLACQAIRDRIRHPEDPIHSIKPSNLFSLASSFVERFKKPLELYQEKEQFPFSCYSEPLQIDPYQLPPAGERQHTPNLDTLLRCLKENFELMNEFFDLHEFLLKEPNHSNEIDYVQNAAKTLVMLIGQALRDLKTVNADSYNMILDAVVSDPALAAKNREKNQFTIYEFLLNDISHCFKGKNREKGSYFQDICTDQLLRVLYATREIGPSLLSILDHLQTDQILVVRNPNQFFRVLDVTAPPFKPRGATTETTENCLI